MRTKRPRSPSHLLPDGSTTTHAAIHPSAEKIEGFLALSFGKLQEELHREARLSNLSQPALVLCNGASGPADGRVPLVLHYLPDQPGRRICIALPSFVDDLLHIPSRTLDLLEIAAYVFASDRLLSRGRKDAVEYHSWSRSIDFCVRVRDFTFWNSEHVKTVLSEALQFHDGRRIYQI